MMTRRLRYDRGALRRFRKVRGLDLTSVAKRARMTKSNVCMLDRGYTEPRATTLAKLAFALNVAVGDFFVEPAP